MPDAPVLDNPSIINQPIVAPPEPKDPQQLLFPDPVTKEPAKSGEPTPPEVKELAPIEPKKEEPKEEQSKPSTETKPEPVDYESLKLPEGSQLSREELAVIKKEAKEHGLSLDDAQGIIEVKNDAVKALLSRQTETLKNLRQEWKTSWQNDPEYGGDKARESTELAKRAWDKLADNELKTLADQTGWGDHPAVLRMLARAGRLFSEDQLIRGNVGTVPKKRSAEEILYGGTTPTEEPMS